MSCSLAYNGTTDFLFTNFVCSKEKSFALSSFAPNSKTCFAFGVLTFWYSGTKKAPEGAKFKNGGNCASRDEQKALAIWEFYVDESSKKVIYLLGHLYAKKPVTGGNSRIL